MNLVWKHAPFQGNTLLALLALADWSDDDGKSWPSIVALANKSRQSERNCHTVIRELQKAKMIEIKERDGKSNLFTINIKLLGVQSLQGVKISKRGGNRLKSLHGNHEMFAPNTSLDTPQDQSHTSNTLISQDSFSLSSPKSLGIRQKEKFVAPSWLPMDEWEGWLEMRRAMRKPATVKAQQYAAEDLDALRLAGENVREIIRKATAKNWLAFYSLKNGYQNGNKPEPEPENALDREAKREREYQEKINTQIRDGNTGRWR